MSAKCCNQMSLVGHFVVVVVVMMDGKVGMEVFFYTDSGEKRMKTKTIKIVNVLLEVSSA